MSDDDKRYTIADCLRMTGDEAKLTNLVRGRLVRRNTRGGWSSLVMMEISMRIYDAIDKHDLKYWKGFNMGYIIERNPDTLVGAGFSFIERTPNDAEDGYFTVPPRFTLEIPNYQEPAEDFIQRIELFLGFGTPLIWAVYPNARVVYAMTPTSTQKLTTGDTLDGGKVLSGFTLPVSDIFNLLDE